MCRVWGFEVLGVRFRLRVRGCPLGVRGFGGSGIRVWGFKVRSFRLGVSLRGFEV